MPPRARAEAAAPAVPTPTVGRVVLVLVAPFFNNGSDVCPAVITRVWSESEPGRWTVNYRLLMDAAPSPALEWKTSAYLYVDEATARAAMKDGPGIPTGMHAFWPPRV